MTTENQKPEQAGIVDLPTFEVPEPTPDQPAPVAPETEEKPKTEEPKKDSIPAQEDTATGVYKNLKRAVSFKINGEELPLYGKANFELNPYAPREASRSRIPITFPSIGTAGVAANAELINSLDFRRDQDARQWLENLDSGLALNILNDGLHKAMNREGSEWVQIPRFNDKPLIGAAAKTPAFENRELKESQALMYALSSLGLGVPFQTPLWHSGFWVNFRPAGEDAWINFHERLTSDKILIGRNSSGLAFSNVNAIFTERALEFALDHMIGHSIQLESTSVRRDIFKYLRAQDIPAFLWGFMVANYPSGYPINRSCTADIGKCSAEISELVNLRLLQVTDDSCLEDRHKAHMAKNYPNAVTEKEVKEYQESLVLTQPREFTLFENETINVGVKLAIPNAEDYMNSGRRWFDGITTMVNEILSKDVTDRQREQTYQKHAKASILREYSHWVKEIKLNSNVVVQESSLENMLIELTPQTDLRESFYKKINTYINDTTLSLIAIPNYSCPTCGKQQLENPENKRFVDSIPLDVSQAFFNLALLRTVEITNR